MRRNNNMGMQHEARRHLPGQLAALSFLLLASGCRNATGHEGGGDQFTGLGAPWNATSCPVAVLPSRINRLNVACCGTTGGSGGRVPILGQTCRFSCSTECISVLLPLWDECRGLLNVLFDVAMDGTFDGRSSALDDAHRTCLARPVHTLVSDLKTLVDEGPCSADDLDEVGLTTAAPASCEDTWHHPCGPVITSGIMSCEDDFCNGASCTTEGQCDSTCGFCPDPGDGRRRLLSELERRRVQSLAQCLPEYFSQTLSAVGQACDALEGVVPSDCDARCAIVFNDFYSKCTRLLTNYVGQGAEMRAWDQLHVTCSTALPPEPLLQAVVKCAPPFVLSAAPPGPEQQILLGPPFATNSTCDVTALPAQIQGLNVACTIGDSCSIACALLLLPLMDSCRVVLNQLYDNDGAFDGEASSLTALRSSCVSIPPADVIEHIKAMHDQGHCPDDVLDEVGATAVKGVVCEDVADRCDFLIASGWTCTEAFCNNGEARCQFAGLCDATCDASDPGAFCAAPAQGSGRRHLSTAVPHDWRRAQISDSIETGDCDPETFSSGIALVDEACCDAGSDDCENGTPSKCDAKCAVVYSSFYGRCRSFLAATVVSPEVMSAFDRLYTACTVRLPTEELLRVVLQCSEVTDTEDQCATTPCCPAGGSCIDLVGDAFCQCHEGFSGEQKLIAEAFLVSNPVVTTIGVFFPF